jgi:hypothetical protein
MFDLGTSFVASVSRDPKALAIVDGEVRLTYEAWYARISAVVAGFDRGWASGAAITSSPCSRTGGRPPPCIGLASLPAWS